MPEFSPNARTEATIVTQQLRGPENQLAARLVVDMADQILVYLPEAQPLLTLTGRLRDKRTATQPQYFWLEKDVLPRVVELSANATDVDVTLNIANGAENRGAAGYVFRNETTGEQVLVGGTAAGQFTTVTRGIGGSSAPMLAGQRLRFLRAVYEDGADVGTPKSVQENSNSNRCEIIRTPYGFTGRDLVVELYGGKDEMTETKWQAIEHKKSIEQAMWFGRQHLMTGTHQRTFMDGIDSRLVTNQWNVAGIGELTHRVVNEALETQMKWGKGGSLARGSGTKYLFASSRWITLFHELFFKDLHTTVLDEQIGFKCFTYVSPHGTINILKTPLFDDLCPDTAFLLDLNHVRYVALRGRDTKLLYDRQGNGIDGRINEYMSDVSVQVEVEFAHSKWFGISV